MDKSKPTDAESELMASVASGKSPWNEAALGKIVDANKRAVETMVHGASLPYCEWGIDTEDGWVVAGPSKLMDARSLAQLNALTAQRLAAHGDSKGATAHLLAGLRFSRDLTQNTPLIDAFVATAVIGNDLNLAGALVQSGRLTAEDKAALVKAVQSLPPDVFDWSRTAKVEMEGIRNGIVRLKKSRDPKKMLADGGLDPDQYGNDPRPSDNDLQQYDLIMREAVSLFGMPSAQAEDGIRALDAKVQKLSPVAKTPLQWFDSANKVRKQVEELRSAFLKKASS